MEAVDKNIIDTPLANEERQEGRSNREDIDDAIMGGVMFSKAKAKTDDSGKVKTKAKKKKYITGAHGSGSAKQKAKYREKRANRHK